MSLTILNNISSLTAENALSNTQTSLQKTLTQLSTGLRINSGADDAAGLSIADGLQANIAALTQSQLNASDGIGMLQTADGALSQVTTMLNRAVTLATEASNSTLDTTGSQAAALNTEFQSILTNINTIGSSTEFNGSAVFSASNLNIAMTDGTASGNMSLSNISVGALNTNSLGLGGTLGSATVVMSSVPAVGDSIAVGGTTYNFVAAGTIPGDATADDVAIGSTVQQTLQNLSDAVNGVSSGANTEYSAPTTANTEVTASDVTGTSLTFTSTSVANNGSAITPTSAGGTMLVEGGATTLAAPATLDLLSTNNAAAALTALTAAISQVAAQRGTVGAGINQLQSLSNVMNTQVQNLQSADNSVMNADIGVTVANMTQYNVLQSTGMAALQQSNQAQQAVLKLVQ